MKKNKVKLQFNPETLSFERVEVSIWGLIKGFMLHLLSSSFIGFLFFVFFVIHNQNLMFAEYPTSEKSFDDKELSHIVR